MAPGVLRKSTVMLAWIAAVLLCRFWVLSRRFNVLSDRAAGIGAAAAERAPQPES